MIEEMQQMPTAQWDGFYGEDGTLYDGVAVTGEDAVLAELMEAWELIRTAEAFDSGNPSEDEDAMAAQGRAADYLENIARMLREYPIAEWRTAVYAGLAGT